jgi:hypothetical protein
VAGLVSRRVHDDEPAVRPGDLVAVVEQRRGRQRPAGERERGTAAVNRDRPIEIERAADVVGMDVREDQTRDRGALFREPAAVLRVERRRIELDGGPGTEDVLVRSGASHQAGIGRQHDTQAGSELHPHASASRSSSSRARRTSACSLA